MNNILWLVNIVFPEAKRLLGDESGLKGTGGWLVASAEALANEDLSLYVVSTTTLVQELTFLKGKKCKYVLIPVTSNTNTCKSYLREIKNRLQPDVIHIHGTELKLGIFWVEECGTNKVVLSIQGVMAAIAKYHHKGVSNWDILSNLTFHDLVRETVWGEQRFFESKSKDEKLLLSQLKYVIGRTSLDRAYSQAVNERIKYFHCDESLRQEFYHGCWSYSNCEKYTIFLSQAQAPLKGLHFLLQAMPIVLKLFPEAKIRIGGQNIVKNKTWQEYIRLTGYGKYIRNLIKRLGIESKVQFLGLLSAEEIKDEMLRANVFVCPSTIENSPNSLAEAQMLGVPCIGSDVGGIPDYIPSEEYGELYRYDDEVMLAYKICKIFLKSNTFDNSNLIEFARKRHDRNTNSKVTLSIYHDIIQSSND